MTTERDRVLGTGDSGDENFEARSSVGRGVNATWWYTFVANIMFMVLPLMVWISPIIAVAGWSDTEVLLPSLVSAGVCVAAFAVVALGYRTATRDLRRIRIRFSRTSLLLVIGTLAAVWLGITLERITLPAALIASLIVILPWAEGVRVRLVAVVTGVVLVGAVLEFLTIAEQAPQGTWLSLIFVLGFTAITPMIISWSMWWWDIVRELDRARQAEGRLVATQERLRMAGDVHDLQGHHLQVIALQLELAERTLARDPAEAMEHILTAQRSVDEARNGTRELALTFRNLTLSGEFDNAADLIGSAGARVRVETSQDVDAAPIDVFGPIIREVTTNILKHGGGRSVAFSLQHADGYWNFVAANDLPRERRFIRQRTEDSAAVTAETGRSRTGNGIANMRERAHSAHGTFSTGVTDSTFTVQVTIPAGDHE